jgi:hypothetical protein
MKEHIEKAEFDAYKNWAETTIAKLIARIDELEAMLFDLDRKIRPFEPWVNSGSSYIFNISPVARGTVNSGH